MQEHLTKDHDMDVTISTHNFCDMEEFEKWKTAEETASRSYFVRNSSSKLYGDTNKFYYYYCNRFGSYKGKGCGKRQLKTQGSCKSEKQCISRIKVMENLVTKAVTVQYCSTHTGHDKDECHLPISQLTKNMISAKLQSGIPVERILDDIKCNLLTDTEAGRNRLLKKQDIVNIQKRLNIDSVQKNPNDLLSVCAWVEELQSLEYNPILCFKPQGEIGKAECSTLKTEDFLLVMQTEFQCNALKQYGKKAVLIDSTHGTTAYEFLLTTILVIDDYGEGLPVAWAISNHEDLPTLLIILQAVKSCCNEITPSVFMSDDAEQYYKAWSTIFGNTTKLLCAWHVDRAWRKSLNNLIEDRQKRIEIYHQLCVLMFEQNCTKFHSCLQKFMSYLHAEYASYFDYFKRNYVGRCEQWATCYRVGSIVNTNMFVEAFHRLLKVVYLNGKQNRRVDKLLHILFRIARDMYYEQILKIEKGKTTHRQCEIQKRHKSAMEMASTCTVERVGENEWKVQSQAKIEVFYAVHRLLQACDCKLHCRSCGSCTHMYSCSCMDSAIHHTVCKHVHLVHISFKEGSSTMSNKASSDGTEIVCEDHAIVQLEHDCLTSNSAQYHPQSLHEQNDTNIKQIIDNLLQKLQEQVKSCDIELFYLVSSLTFLQLWQLWMQKNRWNNCNSSS